MAKLLNVFKIDKFGCRNCILFQVGIFMMFDSVSESIKKSIQGLVTEKVFFGFSKKVKVSKCFLWVIVFYLMYFDVCYLYLNFL